MEHQPITHLRFSNQQLTSSKWSTPKELVSWMGAMQAQDFAMAKWAVGIRLPGLTEMDVEDALNRGEILRTHVLRPTWHLVPAQDICWMLDLSAPQIRSSMQSRRQQLNLTDAAIDQCNALLEDCLKGGRSLTREAIVKEMGNAGIVTADNRASHLLMYAELAQIICSGSCEGNKTTYALLQERVPYPLKLSREEALHKLAFRYFSSHGPATLQDFIWWSGLPAAHARKALELVQGGLAVMEVEGARYWSVRGGHTRGGSPARAARGGSPARAVFLPAFDEYLIAYKDRSAAILKEYESRAFSSNGIFWPVVLENGRVKGLWKRVIKKDAVHIFADAFSSDQMISGEALEPSAQAFGQFLNKKMILNT